MAVSHLSPRKLFILTALSASGRPMSLEELQTLAREFPTTCQLPDNRLLETMGEEGFIKKSVGENEEFWELANN